MSLVPQCWYCSAYLGHAPGHTHCPDCSTPSCSDHLDFHKSLGQCLPFRIAYEEGKGRFLVATRNISAREVILTEHPTIHSPYTKSKPLCLGCYKKVDGSYLCTKCSFPLCNSKCEQAQEHVFECDVISRSDWRPNITCTGQTEKDYAVILPLRCIRLKNTDTISWDRFTTFLSHCREREEEEPEFWRFHQENSVNIIRERLGLATLFSEADINKIIGIMYINSVNMQFPPSHGEATGFYPTYANLNHSCYSNTKTVKLEDNILEVRALFPIRAGEEITTQYVSAEKPTRTRRTILRKKWHFWCSCDRCKDPTELGSFLGGLLCQTIGKAPESGTGIGTGTGTGTGTDTGNGTGAATERDVARQCGGAVLPVNPLDSNSVWKCQDCGSHVSGEEAENIRKAAEMAVRTPTS